MWTWIANHPLGFFVAWLVASIIVSLGAAIAIGHFECADSDSEGRLLKYLDERQATDSPDCPGNRYIKGEEVYDGKTRGGEPSTGGIFRDFAADAAKDDAVLEGRRNCADRL